MENSDCVRFAGLNLPLLACEIKRARKLGILFCFCCKLFDNPKRNAPSSLLFADVPLYFSIT
jgi:hypothetical protein